MIKIFKNLEEIPLFSRRLYRFQESHSWSKFSDNTPSFLCPHLPAALSFLLYPNLFLNSLRLCPIRHEDTLIGIAFLLTLRPNRTANNDYDTTGTIKEGSLVSHFEARNCADVEGRKKINGKLFEHIVKMKIPSLPIEMLF